MMVFLCICFLLSDLVSGLSGFLYGSHCMFTHWPTFSVIYRLTLKKYILGQWDLLDCVDLCGFNVPAIIVVHLLCCVLEHEMSDL